MNNCLAKCCAKGLQPLSYILVKTLIGATSESPFKSIDELCGDWHEKWREL